MLWYDYVLHFIAGAVLANGVPHFVQGICGNKFQTPFARPRGVGESSALVNVIWGWVNFVIAGGNTDQRPDRRELARHFARVREGVQGP